MDAATVATLRNVNQRFYASVAREFSASRSVPWPGWTRAVAHRSDATPLRVLDAGCGNARFLSFLRELHRGPVAYLGVDACPALLEEARPRTGSADRLCRHDLLDAPLPTARVGDGFDLVVAFGLLHHIPAFANRRGLLQQLSGLLRPGAILALTCWRFGELARFRGRMRPWSALPAPSVDAAQLEAGDHLLAWGNDPSALRYCHAVGEAELTALLAGLALELLDDYCADGPSDDSNRYCVLRPRSNP